MPPVNDDPFPRCEDNCALCCIAGLVDSTAATVRARMTRTLMRVPDEMRITAQFGRRFAPNFTPNINTESNIVAQIAGVMVYMARLHGMVPTAWIGRLRDRLTAEQAEAAMLECDDDAEFMYLVTPPEKEVKTAHWIVARKVQGAIEYTDYQLDSPNFINRFLPTKANLALVGHGPSVTDVPMRAFGEKTQDTDRMLAIQFRPQEGHRGNQVFLEGQ